MVLAAGPGFRETAITAGPVIRKKNKDFMLSHGYIKNDFDVKKWAALKFLEEAAKELVKERWHKVTREKLSMPTPRLG
jgi:hypothetical protein